MYAPSAPATRLMYARHGRRPPKPGVARALPPTPRLFEAQYKKRVDALVRAWWDHVETLARAELRQDAFSDDLSATWRALVRASGIEPWLRRNANTVAGAQATYVERVANLPVGSAIPREYLEEFLQDNVSLITQLPDAQIQKIADIIRPAQAGGQRWEDVAKSLEERLGVARSRAQLIARDQANKFNSVMAEVTQTAAGIEEYEWVTANDYAVRGRPGGEYADSKENHWALRGKIFRWDSPPLIPGTSERAHPGQRIQCRCTAKPVISDLFPRRAAPARPADIVAQETEAGYPYVGASVADTEIPHEAVFGQAEFRPEAVNVAAVDAIGGLQRAQYLRTGYRPESLAAVRGANEAKLPPVTVDVAHTGDVSLTDGRHRLMVAVERGRVSIPAHVRQRNAEGDIVATRLARVRT